MKIPISYIYRNLWTRRLTSALTTGGIGLVVFVFAAVLMLSNGIRNTLVSTGSEKNIIVVRKSTTTEMMSAVSRESTAIVKSFPEVRMAGQGRPFASGEVVVIINLLKKGSSDIGNVVARGISREGFDLRPGLFISSGRKFVPGTAEIIVGQDVAGRFQGCSLGQQLRFGGRDWTIVGIFDSGGRAYDSEIWGDVELLMPAFGRPAYSAVTLRLNRPADFSAFVGRMSSDPRLDQLEAVRETEFFAKQSEVMAMFISVLGLVITIIFSVGAMVGAMITMYAAVANRTAEIGTLRVLGFRRRSILAAFMIESLLLSLVGGGIGILIASSLQFITISTVNWGSFSELAFGFSLSLSIAFNAMLFSVIMGLIGGFLPAVRASRMKILDALRAV